MLRIITTADTEILATAAAVQRLPGGFPEVRCANPSGLAEPASLIDDLLAGARVVLCRILGGRRGWDGFDLLRERCLEAAIPLIALGGEAEPDAEMTALSLAPAGAVVQAGEYLCHCDPENVEQLLRFLADTFLLEGYGFDPARELPDLGVYVPCEGDVSLQKALARCDEDRPTVGVCFYRSHRLSGNTAFIDALVEAVEEAGANAIAVWSRTLRADAEGRIDALELLSGHVDALILTMLATGGSGAADARDPDGEAIGEQWQCWDAKALEALDVPVIQAVCATRSRAWWEQSDTGLAPLDVATQVAIPEFDGRLLGGVISFKEREQEGTEIGMPVARYVPDRERCARVARIAAAHARLRRLPASNRRVAIMLTSFPTKHARIGMAVGLDTPASALELLEAMKADGMRIENPFETGDALMHALIAAGGQDPEFLTEEQLASTDLRMPVAEYLRWYETLPRPLRESIEARWGPPPGEHYLIAGGGPLAGRQSDGCAAGELSFAIAGLELGNVLIAIAPPRGHGQGRDRGGWEERRAIYHDAELPPTHHYLACYRWLEAVWGADAVVHLGKHGTLEWLPGKTVGLSASCAPDAAIGALPLIYPFVVNDPGEGVQAKRRAHALIVDHLVPPMMRAGTSDELSELEALLDEYARLEVLDPPKLPALAARIWSAIEAANLQADLDLGEGAPEAEDLSALVQHIDGYLCEVKDIQIKDGLHVLGRAPEGQQLRGLLSAMLKLEREEEPLLAQLEEQGFDPAHAAAHARAHPRLARAPELVDRIRRTGQEIESVLAALHGRHVASGPSGSPTRGRPDVLPTGRNFYSVDPRALPSELSFEVGQRLAEALLARHEQESGRLPEMVGLVVWGTSAMRTEGDDVSEILALLGVRPVWDHESRRVRGVEVIPLAQLGRPRIDVTVRISGFFRDAFPHLLALIDEAIGAVARLDESDEQNFVAAHVRADAAKLAMQLGEELGCAAPPSGSSAGEGAGAAPAARRSSARSQSEAVRRAWRQATTRIFGSKPGAYGSGLPELLDCGEWRGRGDIAEVYEAWGGYAYGEGLDGVPAKEQMRACHSRIEAAVKNVDSQEQDIFDSGEFFAYHGGMVAMASALRGESPATYVGDSSKPSSVRTRTLSEEARRIFRARVANPRWIASMIRHGYKGAAELSATVDYLFGYDATANVLEDWMYERIAERYLLEQDIARFMSRSNPWAARAIAERLLEAVDRGLWERPSERTVEAIRQRFLSLEGELEEGGPDAAVAAKGARGSASDLGELSCELSGARGRARAQGPQSEGGRGGLQADEEAQR